VSEGVHPYQVRAIDRSCLVPANGCGAGSSGVDFLASRTRVAQLEQQLRPERSDRPKDGFSGAQPCRVPSAER
jgi:hypothetical protein